MMGLCPLHNAFYMLTLYADAHLQQFLINCSGFPPDYIKSTFLVKPRLVILFQKSITVLHISVNVHIFFDNFLVFFSTILRGTMIWCPQPMHFSRKSAPTRRISHSLLPHG